MLSYQCRPADSRPVRLTDHLHGWELTPPELEVLAGVADGLTDEQIARRRIRSVSTCKHQLQRLLAKLGANNRAHAVAIALRSGVLQ